MLVARSPAASPNPGARLGLRQGSPMTDSNGITSNGRTVCGRHLRLVGRDELAAPQGTPPVSWWEVAIDVVRDRIVACPGILLVQAQRAEVTGEAPTAVQFVAFLLSVPLGAEMFRVAIGLLRRPSAGRLRGIRG